VQKRSEKRSGKEPKGGGCSASTKVLQAGSIPFFGFFFALILSFLAVRSITDTFLLSLTPFSVHRCPPFFSLEKTHVSKAEAPKDVDAWENSGNEMHPRVRFDYTRGGKTS
jgi:hypothetical protein